jgi:hypothetical protein
MADAGILPKEQIRELLNDFPALEDGDDIQDAEVIEEDLKEE